MPHLYSISQEDAQSAFSEASRNLASEKTHAALLRRLIASPLIGAYCTARLVPKLEKLYPEYTIRYSSSNQYRRVYLIPLQSDLNSGPRNYFCLTLATAQNPRINQGSLKTDLARDESTIAALTSALSEFWSILSQWNNLVPYVSKLRESLLSVMSYGRYYH